MSTIRVKISVDSDELRKWAEWHVDRGHHGVAHVLYKALEGMESLSEQAVREAKAQAWEEGHDTCCAVYVRHCAYASDANPYATTLVNAPAEDDETPEIEETR